MQQAEVPQSPKAGARQVLVVPSQPLQQLGPKSQRISVIVDTPRRPCEGEEPELRKAPDDNLYSKGQFHDFDDDLMKPEAVGPEEPRTARSSTEAQALPITGNLAALRASISAMDVFLRKASAKAQ